MTSYPLRIGGAWLSLESLFRQEYRDFVLVLVLGEREFPDRKLPLMIRLQIRQGLRILWVAEDNRSFDHLWPAYTAYPEASVISVDDDKIFPPSLIGTLVAASVENPEKIVGSRGWKMRRVDGSLSFGSGWVRADNSTDSRELFMPPGNGSLYPPGSLPALAGDIRLMRRICPRADDVWYWSMARIKGTESVCLGLEAHRPSRVQQKTPALASESPGVTEFAAVCQHFGDEVLQLGKIS